VRKTRSLKSKILVSSLIVIGVFALITGCLNFFIVKYYIIERAKKQMQNNLKVARLVLYSHVEVMRKSFSLVKEGDDLNDLRKKTGLDYLFLVDHVERSGSDIVRRAARMNTGVGGLRIIPRDELKSLGEALFDRAKIDIRATPRARPAEMTSIESAMSIEFAQPLSRSDGTRRCILVGGRIVNRDFRLTDEICHYVFESGMIGSKPLGTATIFQEGVRIATNVLDESGHRAVGTQVSSKVYEKVVEHGEVWVDRAFVVTDWYLTAYEPLKDIDGNIIGILYVGMLEQPFREMENRITLSFFVTLSVTVLLSLLLSLPVAEAIAKPTANVLIATEKISGGNLSYRLKEDTRIKELNSLAEAFNTMAEKLDERERSLKISNEKMAALNKSYLDLIGFVSHELKGILASTLLNAYTVRDGFLGMINFKQRKALDAVVRNLDYFDQTVKNFLNLSRLEKGELTVDRRELSLKEDIFDPAVEDIQKPASEKNIDIENNLEPAMKVRGDYNLLQIVANNLVGNAVKYGVAGGKIVLSCSVKDDAVEVDVFNEGRPITTEEAGKLFRKFSRLDAAETRRAKGTGLGLFITREIIEQHGGTIRVQPREKGKSFIFQIERGKTRAESNGTNQEKEG